MEFKSPKSWVKVPTVLEAQEGKNKELQPELLAVYPAFATLVGTG